MVEARSVPFPRGGGGDAELAPDRLPRVLVLPRGGDAEGHPRMQLGEEAGHGVKVGEPVAEGHGRAQECELDDCFIEDRRSGVIDERTIGMRRRPGFVEGPGTMWI